MDQPEVGVGWCAPFFLCVCISVAQEGGEVYYGKIDIPLCQGLSLERKSPKAGILTRID